MGQKQIHPGKDESVPLGSEGLTRRRVMAWGLWAIMGAIGVAAAWPVVELASRGRTRPKKLVYFPAMMFDEMPEVGIMKAELKLRGGERPDTRVFIKRAADGSLTALSAICTHLGCLVSFNRVKGEFICPCHGGKYDAEGRPIAGPPPTPLRHLPVRVSGDSIEVGFMV